MNFLDSLGWSKKLSHATVPISQALAHVTAEKNPNLRQSLLKNQNDVYCT